MSIDYKADFAAAPLGPLTDANKRLVWAPAPIAWSDNPEGKYHSIIDDPLHGRVCETLYKGNVAGASGKQYQVGLGPCSEPITLEYDVLVRSGFDMSHGGGKIGPMICWGPFAGSNAGVVCMVWWSTPGAQPAQSWQCVLQNQPDGKQYITPTANGPMRGPTIDRDVWHHWKLEMLGGPDGYATYSLDGGVLNYTVRGQFGNTALGNNCVVNVSGFYGGGTGSAPPSDGRVLVANMHVYQGQSEAGNGDGGDTGGDGGITPTPPAGEHSRFSVGLGEVKIFRARFLDTSSYPAKEIPAGGAVKWSLQPNNVSWGSEAGPNWSAIQVKGKTVGEGCVLVATDPASGISTEPVRVDITETPRPQGADTGLCSVEPLTGRSGGDQSFLKEPPQ